MSIVADALATLATGQCGLGKSHGHRQLPTSDDIARCAYHLYEMRGRQDGHHIEDWLLAERQLTSQPSDLDFLVMSRPGAWS